MLNKSPIVSHLRPGEPGKLYDLLKSPGMPLLKKLIVALAEDQLLALEKGGKEQHDRNVGKIEGIKIVLNAFEDWKRELIKMNGEEE